MELKGAIQAQNMNVGATTPRAKRNGHIASGNQKIFYHIFAVSTCHMAYPLNSL